MTCYSRSFAILEHAMAILRPIIELQYLSERQQIQRINQSPFSSTKKSHVVYYRVLFWVQQYSNYVKRLASASKVLTGELRNRMKNGQEKLWNFLAPSELASQISCGFASRMVASHARKNNSASYAGEASCFY